MGKEEAVFTSLINIMGLIGGLYLFRKLKETGSNAFIALLLLISSQSAGRYERNEYDYSNETYIEYALEFIANNYKHSYNFV